MKEVNNIYNSSTRRHGRTREQIYKSCQYLSLEYGLAYALRGKVNDPSESGIYHYDVTSNGLNFEVKRQSPGTTWFSYKRENIKYFLDHVHDIDYLVAAYMTELEDSYSIMFSLLIDAKTFDRYYKRSIYPNGSDYYDHHKAIQNNHCINLLG